MYAEKFTALPPPDWGGEQSQRRGSILFPGPSWRKSRWWQFARREMMRRGVLNRFDLRERGTSADASRIQAARVACNGTPSITRATQPCCGPTQGNLRFFSRFNVPASSANFVLSATHASCTRDRTPRGPTVDDFCVLASQPSYDSALRSVRDTMVPRKGVLSLCESSGALQQSRVSNARQKPFCDSMPFKEAQHVHRATQPFPGRFMRPSKHRELVSSRSERARHQKASRLILRQPFDSAAIRRPPQLKVRPAGEGRRDDSFGEEASPRTDAQHRRDKFGLCTITAQASQCSVCGERRMWS